LFSSTPVKCAKFVKVNRKFFGLRKITAITM
jgi:hypothetical protein